MPSDPQRPQEPAWRQPVKPAARKPDAQPAWRREGPGAPASPGSGGRKWGRLGLAGLGTALAIGGLVYLILLLRPPAPTGLILIGAAYKQNLALPHNAYGWNGLEQLSRWAAQLKNDSDSAYSWNRGTLRLVEPFILKKNGLGDWDKELKKSKEQTVILYLALHGSADENGPYLFIEDTDYSYSQRWRLKDILASLKELPPKNNKVLILDTTQLSAHWPSGMLRNEFADALEALDPEIEAVPNLVVISASDKDQSSWVDHRLGTTVFSHCVLKGLQGSADDPSQGGESTGRITAWELYQYLHREVPKTVAALYDHATQTPVLLPRQDGEKRARSIALMQVLGGTPETPSPPKLDAGALDLVSAHWTASRKLWQEAAPDAHHTPFWRLYLDTLLRYEQLLRAGEPASSDDLKALDGRLGSLETALRTLPLTNPASLPNTLAMPVAFGFSPPAERDHERFKQIWANPDPEKVRADLTKWLDERDEGKDKKLLRLSLSQWLLDEAAARPEKISALLSGLEAGSTVRSAETHFLVMFHYLYPMILAGGSPEDQPLKYMPLAVHVRQLAEEAALGVDRQAFLRNPQLRTYSEQIQPWIHDQIQAGDRARRLGEDLLYGPRSAWERAKGHLETAQQSYEDAKKTAHVVQDSLALRDQVLAELPYYAQWLARERISTPRLLDTLTSLEAMLENTHEMARLLDAGTKTSLEQLQKTSALVRTHFQHLQDGFQRRCQELEQQALQANWDEIEGVLSTPLVEPSQRTALLKASQNIADLLHDKGSSAVTTPTDHHESESQALALAQHQGRMAVALLGDAWIRNCDSTVSLPLLQDRIAKASGETWRKSMEQVGATIGHCWQELPGKVIGLTKTGVQQDLPAGARSLSEAARWARLVDGPGALAMDKEEARPLTELRHLQLHDLLVWQADRAIQDHWYGENDAPYYKRVGKAYLDDAGELVGAQRPDVNASQREARLAIVNKKRKYLESARELEIASGLARWDLTSERSLPLSYRVTAPEETLPAYPVFWRKLDPQYLALKDRRQQERFTVDEFAEQKPQSSYTDHFDVESRLLDHDEARPPSQPTAVPTQVGFGAVFRGHLVPKETPIVIHRVPDLGIFQSPRPVRSGVEVRADGPTYRRFASNNAAIVIILDCSDSMTTVQPDGTTRFDQVKLALKRMLRAIPKGARVSVWAYGEEKAGAMRVPDDAERTIERLHSAPIVWDPTDPTPIASLEEEVDRLKPRNWTPIVRSMMEAREDFRGTEGLKTMIILTDGMDTRFEKASYDIGGGKEYHCRGDDTYNPDGRETISSFIPKAFRDSGIQINIVGFQLGGEEEKARAQFEKAIESLPVPGKFFLAKEPGELVATLQHTLQQRLRYTLEKDNGYPVPPRDGVEVTSVGRNAKWTYSGLNPGVYTVKAHLLRQPILLDPGDFLLVTLTRNGFERALYADDFKTKPRDEKQKDWLPAILQNYRKPDGSLQLMATLENKAVQPTTDGTIKQQRPTFVWFEVQPAKAAKPTCLRWGNLEYYPAPSWSMEVADWPTNPDEGKPVQPEVEAWWISDGLPEMVGPLRPDDPQKPFDAYFKDRPIRIEGKEVVIESALFEERTVGNKRDVPCLVVRLRYPPREPVVARVSGMEVNGVEQRIYAQANKTTAVFWPVQRSQANNIALHLISINAFKNKPAPNSRPAYHSRFELPAPTSLNFDDRPDPIQVNTLNSREER